MELQNANPTIINLSDLPTRRRDKTIRNKNKIHNARQPGPHFAALTPYDSGLLWDGSLANYRTRGLLGVSTESWTRHQQQGDFGSDDDGDPIDEQEIFGISPPSSLPLSLLSHQTADIS